MKEKEKHAARETRLIGTDRAPAGPSETNRAPVGQRLEKNTILRHEATLSKAFNV